MYVMCALIRQVTAGIEARVSSCLDSRRCDAMLPATARRVRIIMLVMQCASSWRVEEGKECGGRGHRACHTHTRTRTRNKKPQGFITLASLVSPDRGELKMECKEWREREVGEEGRAGTEVAADTFHANKLAQARALHATYLPWRETERERERAIAGGRQQHQQPLDIVPQAALSWHM